MDKTIVIQNDNELKIDPTVKVINDNWKEIPEYSIELVRDRSIKYRKLYAGTSATNREMREDAVAFVHKLLDNSPTEQFIAIFVNNLNEVIGATRVAHGEAHSVPIDIKNLFRAAIAANADRILLAHNHPMGDATASEPDIMFTATAIETAQLLGIDILDHIVVSPNGTYYSLFDHKDRFEEVMTGILKGKGGELAAVGELLTQIMANMPPPESGDVLGHMNMEQIRNNAAKRAYPEGNPLTALMNKLGLGGSDKGGNGSPDKSKN